jgi:arylsulfatase A-like enzyme
MMAIERRRAEILVLSIWIAVAASSSAARPPNIVLVLTDNQGAWTLGCYGNPDIRTPNIDRLAREGMLFERCYSSNAVCSPTRATLLTGLMPSQHGVHSYLAARGAQLGPQAYSTIAEFRTLPEILADAGYTCGLVGKWHLGDNRRPQEGFTYWLTMPHGHTRTFYNAQVIERGDVRNEPRYLTEFWTDHAARFIEENKDQPFFLLLAYNGPYGLGESMLHPPRNRHAAHYAQSELESFPREKMHPWLSGNKKLFNNIAAMRRYAAEVSAIDDGVGRILAALEKLQIDDHTLIIFTADQGLACGHGGFWGMGDHTRPLSAFDAMIHVPLIYRHTGHIRAGQRPSMLVSNYDFLPTLLDYVDVDPHLRLGDGGVSAKNPLPRHSYPGPFLPGRSYSRTLTGKRQQWDNTIFFEYETTRAIRTADWKYIERHRAGPNELYHLAADSGERRNLVDTAAHAAQQNELRARLHKFFTAYADPLYDLTGNGHSKAPRRSK